MGLVEQMDFLYTMLIEVRETMNCKQSVQDSTG